MQRLLVLSTLVGLISSASALRVDPQTNSTILDMGVFMRLSRKQNSSANSRVPLGDAWNSAVASTLMSAIHFNTRNGSVLPVYASSNLTDCNVTIVPHVFDTLSREKPALDTFLRARYETGWTNKPDVIIGTDRSATSTVLALVAGINEVPQISHMATSPTLDLTSTYPTFSRTVPSDTAVARTLAELFRDLGYKSVGVIYVNDPYGSGYNEGLHTECSKLGITVNSFAFTFGNAPSIQSAVANIKSLGLQVIVSVVFDDDLQELMIQAHEQQVATPNHLWVFTDSIRSGVLLTDARAQRAMHGSLRAYATGMVDGTAGFENLRNAWSSWETMRPQLNTYMPPTATDPSFNAQLPAGYFSSQSLDQRIQATTFGDASTYAFDAVATVALAACELNPSGITGLELSDRMTSQVFEGVSGTVSFDQYGSRDPSKAVFQIFNIRYTDAGVGTQTRVGQYSEGAWNIDWDSVEFADGTSAPPNYVTIPTEDRKLLSPGLKSVAFLLCAVNICMALGLMVWTIVQRHSAIVKASQPPFLILVCIGCITSSSAIIPLSYDDGPQESLDAACVALPWLYSVGFVITFGTLFGKLWRVMKIFHNKSLKRMTLRDSALFGRIGLVVMVDIFLLITWTVGFPISWRRTILTEDSYGYPLTSVGQCSGSAFGTFVGIVFTFHIALLLYGNLLAYMARKIPTKFQEGKYIGLCLVTYFQVMAISAPVNVMVSNDPNPAFFTRVGVVFINDFAVLSFIFGPKIYTQHYHKASRDSPMRRGATGSGNPSSTNVSIETLMGTGSSTNSFSKPERGSAGLQTSKYATITE